ncbi:hypothetical protein [Metabacillus sediminilitoris]|nr:hypothetical protein [Metabacillus sediminilitoris]
MWVITQYSRGNISMYEFKTEQEARDRFNMIQGNKILSEVIYYNDPSFQ